jgi:hypothetical protein
MAERKKPVFVFIGAGGDMTSVAMRHSLAAGDLQISPLAISEPGKPADKYKVEGKSFAAIPGDHIDAIRPLIDLHRDAEQEIIGVDFSREIVEREDKKINVAPTKNIALCADLGFSGYILGSTMVESDVVRGVAKERGIRSMQITNMAFPVIAFQQFMRGYAVSNPNYFAGHRILGTESHQAKKGKDKSGTMDSVFREAMVPLGLEGATYDEMWAIRNPETQRALGVPERALPGHGWHIYAITSFAPSERIDKFAEVYKEFLRTNKMLDEYVRAEGAPKAEGIFPNLKSFEFRVPLLDRIGSEILDEQMNVYSATANDGNSCLALAHIPRHLVVPIHDVNGRDIYGAGCVRLMRFAQSDKWQTSPAGTEFKASDVC